jgi:hypothetical protein
LKRRPFSGCAEASWTTGVAGGLVRSRGLLHILQRAVAIHAPELDRDAVGRGLLADIVEHDLRAAPAVEDDTRRRDEKVADPGLGRSGKGDERSGKDSRGN